VSGIALTKNGRGGIGYHYVITLRAMAMADLMRAS
jgi:hypothetical protein